jgi:hypothetical protein
MTIYKKRTPSRVYRKIYETHYGPIPKESNGRTYQIHHIDGDHSNNSPDNLKAVTVEEHYNIHYAQGDWAACHFMTSQHINKTPEEISELQNKLVREGTHPLVGKNNPCHQRIKDGTHHFLGGDIQRLHGQKKVSDGTHHLLGGDIQRMANAKRIKRGDHHLLGASANLDMLAKGKHPSQIKKICPHCGKICDSANFNRWHGDKCKSFR